MSFFGRVSRIAHLSDVHLLDTRPSFDLRCRFVSIYRPLDAAARAKKFLGGLRAALRAGADHVVISGDLTEMGTPTEYERVAELLAESCIDPDAVTLVPGNHDAYTAPDGWRRALAGPLAPYARGSALEPGKVVERGDLVLLPLDVTKYQSVARSGGELSQGAADAVERRLADPAFRGRAVAIVQHHPPFSNPKSPWHFIDGLAGYARMLKLLLLHPRVPLLHGHAHQTTDRVVRPSALGDAVRRGGAPFKAMAAHLPIPRVFGAPAIVEDQIGAPRVRLYDVRDGRLESIGLAAA